jgi:hypothetical protein
LKKPDTALRMNEKSIMAKAILVILVGWHAAFSRGFASNLS